jgi:glycosyltransferase involved in cell wall biosynthesis
MNIKESPLVSCVMPTYNRRRFIPHAIDYFLRQDYANKELIVIDDGTDIIQDLIPDHPLIRHYRLDKKITLGAKLNLACSYAQGKIIVNWDDDDWYSETRLTCQVECIENEKFEVCGINDLLYYDLINNTGYRYIYPADQRKWLLGSSLCYTKKLWSTNLFADINVGMDGLFVFATPSNKVKVMNDPTMSVHMIHENNVSPKKTNAKWWHSYPVIELQKIMKDDWYLYNTEKAKPCVKTVAGSIELKSVKNIYACLVHENKACVIDLARNLRYHDPSSVILIYNGGPDSNLLDQSVDFEKSGTIIYPKPSMLKHGYLHKFAIDCMEFSLSNFSFDTLTIVDSDQLAIRSGYSEYIGKHLSKMSHVGVLSSNPNKIDKTNTTNRVALQMFKEYDLWKNFVNTFKDGEQKIAYWTFWPSTVFTRDAAKDLVKLFKENSLLHSILDHTKIWASEEVILPTVIKLLGYEIALNPCSYDFVQYRKNFTPQDVKNAIGKTDAYWIHPVERIYNSPVRQNIRDYFSNYSTSYKCNESHQEVIEDKNFDVSVIKKINEIEGWLSNSEANLLIATINRVCEESADCQNIVEVGSYHGKATILIGTVIKKYFPEARIYSIDPHDGLLGDAVKGLQKFPPSYDNFKNNIQNSQLSNVVTIIKNNSYNVHWELPISFLLIDGLHDYENVVKDFQHFSKWIIKDGYVAFHDYATYFPGVIKFVNELLQNKLFEKIDKADSLMILKKLQ